MVSSTIASADAQEIATALAGFDLKCWMRQFLVVQ